MNKKVKRTVSRTEFWIFLVLIVMCIAIQIRSGGQLMEPSTVVTILRSMVVDGMFAMICLVVMISGRFVIPGNRGSGVFSVHHDLFKQWMVQHQSTGRVCTGSFDWSYSWTL